MYVKPFEYSAKRALRVFVDSSNFNAREFHVISGTSIVAGRLLFPGRAPGEVMRVDAAQAAVQAAVPFYFQPSGDCPGDGDTTDGLTLCALMPAVAQAGSSFLVLYPESPFEYTMRNLKHIDKVGIFWSIEAGRGAPFHTFEAKGYVPPDIPENWVDPRTPVPTPLAEGKTQPQQSSPVQQD